MGVPQPFGTGGWRLGFSELKAEGRQPGWMVWWEFQRPDSDTGEMGWGRGRDEIIWQGTTVSGIIKTCWVAFELVVKHEMMHAFKFRKKTVFDPHATVDMLLSISEQSGGRAQDAYKMWDSKQRDEVTLVEQKPKNPEPSRSHALVLSSQFAGDAGLDLGCSSQGTPYDAASLLA